MMFCWNWAGFWRATLVNSVVEVNSPFAGNIMASHVVSLLKRFSDELNLLAAPLVSFSGAELDAFDV